MRRWYSSSSSSSTFTRTRKQQLAIRFRTCLLFVLAVVFVMTVGYCFQLHLINQVFRNSNNTSLHKDHEDALLPRINRCAICLYGLPRAFKTIVLPSLKEHVIRPNAPFGCDYFVHYYNVSAELPGRSGKGGKMHPDEVLALRNAVNLISDMNGGGGSARHPTVLFEADTNEHFWTQHGALVDKVRNTKDQQGRYLYYPWKVETYSYPTTTDNILKMWHSIQSSWELMQKHGTTNGITYNRVIMLRSDVMYMTPIHVWEKEPGVKDTNNNVAVIPSFGMFPVSDRLIYGPSRAVEIWATQRFKRLEAHVQWILHNLTGFGLHSERFVNYALLPPIRDLGFQIIQHPTLCFFRARADEHVWISDCQSSTPGVVAASVTEGLAGTPVRDQVERLLGRKCGNTTEERRHNLPRYTALNCNSQQPGNKKKKKIKIIKRSIK